jgi:Tfp pilus assembly protein PilZ
MPLMGEFAGLERKRLGDGVTPFEFRRRLDLKGQIGQNFAKSRQAGLSAMGGDGEKARPMVLLVEYKTRDHLIESVISNVQPAGLFVPTPFAAEIGKAFLVRISIEQEGQAADVTSIVVTSTTQGADTLSTMSRGMSLKFCGRTGPRAAGSQRFSPRCSTQNWACPANATRRFPHSSECGRGSDTLAP